MSKIRCAECGKELEESDIPEDSHGLCPDCRADFLAKYYRWKEEEDSKEEE